MSWKSTEKIVKKGPLSTIFVAVFLMTVLSGSLFFVFGGANYLKERYYNPQIESAKRIAFEETRSYNVGNREEIRRLKKEYDLADDSEKEILGQYILEQFSEMDWTMLPSDLQLFLESL